MELQITDRIRERKVDFFNNVNVTLKYDSVASTFSFNFLYDPKNYDHRQLTCLSHYHVCKLTDNGEVLLTGTILSNKLPSSNVQELVSFGGYSTPGVLEDCQIPISAYPLESNGLTLRQIAKKILNPFGISMVVDPAVAARMDKVIEKTTADNTQTCKDYLCQLAAQRNIIVTHTPNGWLHFTEAKTDRPSIFHFIKGQDGVTFELDFNGQGIHSEITVIKEADDEGGNVGQVTKKNPYCPIVFRPKVMTQSSGDDIDTEQAAINAVAQELKNITVQVFVASWYINGRLWRPNQIISITNDELYLFKKTDFFIESVTFTGNQVAQTVMLTCVLKEVYNGKAPINVFVSDHYKQNG